MAFDFKSLSLRKLAIIGAGHIGPDIALHFARNLASNGAEIVLIDIVDDALVRAREKFERKVDRLVERGSLAAELAARVKGSIEYTTDYGRIAGANLVLEAATEDEAIKHRIFEQVERICDDHCILLSNSSHMQPEEIMLLKCFDSAGDGRARYTAHSAFHHPAPAAGAPTRRSIEVRTLAWLAP